MSIPARLRRRLQRPSSVPGRRPTRPADRGVGRRSTRPSSHCGRRSFRTAGGCGSDDSPAARWIALACVAVAELALWTVARFVPLEAAPVAGARDPGPRHPGWLAVGVRSRPRLGEAALAVDAEGSLGDRVSSALELAAGFPASAGPPPEDVPGRIRRIPVSRPAPVPGRRSTRRQRWTGSSADSDETPWRHCGRCHRVSSDRGCRIAAALVAAAALLLLAPALLLPNPQDAVIAQQQAGPRRGRAAGRPHRSRRGGARDQGPERGRPAHAARPGVARPRPTAARAPERPRREPRPPGRDRERRPVPRSTRPTSSGRRRSRRSVAPCRARRPEDPTRTTTATRRRPAKTSRLSADKLDEMTPAAATRTRAAARRARGDGLAGRWRGRHGAPGRGAEPRPGRHRRRPVGARSARRVAHRSRPAR